MRHASFGSVSSGTLLPEDLLGSFADELEYQVQRNAAFWINNSAARDRHMKLIGDAREVEDFDSEEASEIVTELCDALTEFAPPYAYFGAHPGDGADFGYWITEDLDGAFDGLRVADTSEVPEDYSGEVLHVNDHGNMTLYSADKGSLTEIWGVV
jgi:hypothetical protein